MFPKPKRKIDEGALEAARNGACCVCGARPPGDPSHVHSRGAGGPDTKWNVVPMCRGHHTEWHAAGPSVFIRRHPGFGLYLTRLGWEVTHSYAGVTKLWHPEDDVH